MTPFRNPNKKRERERERGEGLLKSSEGNWLKGFARLTSHTTSVMGELWDLKDRLLIALQIWCQ